MARNLILFSALAIGLAIFATEGLRDFALSAKSAKAPQQARAPAAARPVRTASRAQAGGWSGDTLVVPAGPGGHYLVDAEVNGRDLRFLVDTGASMVALSRDDAEEIGINPYQLDYTGRVKTANGIAPVATVMIDEIAIGDIVVRNVRAAVIDAPLDLSLLGMTFLSRLSGFEVTDKQLILRR